MNSPHMKYNFIKKAGIYVSNIGFGCEGLFGNTAEDNTRMLRTAIDHGINLFDVFTNSFDSEVLGSTFKRKGRSRIHIQAHINFIDAGGPRYAADLSRDLARCKENFTHRMVNLRTDYIDIGMFSCVDNETDYSLCFETEMYDWVLKMKEEGKIRGIGVSCHSAKIAKKIAENELVDVIMFGVNPVFDMTPEEYGLNDLIQDTRIAEWKEQMEIQKDRMDLYRICEEKEIAIVAMKALFAGRLLQDHLSPLDRSMAVHQCIQYALDRPAVVSAILGFENVEEIEQAVSIWDATPEELDYSEFLIPYKNGFNGNCLYCNHCQPCPNELDIASIIKLTDLSKQGGPATFPEYLHYRCLHKTAKDCTECGECVKRCPFSVNVLEKMSQAREVFGF